MTVAFIREPKTGSSDLDPRPHAIVIGSGFGGLAAAIRLGARGYRVTVLEKLEQAGGRASVFRQDGFAFDAGPTIITAPHMLEELWTLCGRKMADDLTLRAIDPFYRICFENGKSFDYSGDPDRMRAEVAKFNPADVAGFERFVKASEDIFKVGFEQLVDQPFGSFLDMVKIAPALLRLESYRTVYSLVSKHIQDPQLRELLSFHPLLVGGNPFAASAIFCLIAFLERKWGVHFAMGGMGAVVQGLVGLIEGQGGTLRCNATVSRIEVSNRRATGVTLANGETLAADIVVSNADSAYTYRSMIEPQHRRRWTDRKVENMRYSMGLFVWYFGTKRRYEDVQHHTILMGPRYRDLLRDIFERKHLSDDFSLYLHRPTATDPTLAPPGCDAFYVLSPVPHMDAGVDWTQQAEPYRRRIADYLSSTLLPDLEANVVSSRMLTPLDFQDRYLSFKGAAFGMEPILTQSAWFRPHNRSEDIDNLFLVGAGTHPGAGVPGVLASARVLDAVVPHARQFV
ncbi:MAG: phytoene desaturase [Magnetospirillum sp.]|nr:phytoene desaturase [Magnetospirillum sp.]